MMRLIAAGLLALSAATDVAIAQKPFRLPAGRLYVFHSGPGSGCPGVDWYIVAEAGDTLAGFIAWNNLQSLARATGSLNRRAGTFEMTAHEVGGRTELSLSPERSVGPLGGSLPMSKGVSCRGIKVPWFTPPGRTIPDHP
jgi:hypothetical protein